MLIERKLSVLGPSQASEHRLLYLASALPESYRRWVGSRSEIATRRTDRQRPSLIDENRLWSRVAKSRTTNRNWEPPWTNEWSDLWDIDCRVVTISFSNRVLGGKYPPVGYTLFAIALLAPPHAAGAFIQSSGPCNQPPPSIDKGYPPAAKALRCVYPERAFTRRSKSFGDDNITSYSQPQKR